ncbi:DUF6153 family protein [Streptomyces sp. SP18ES09]|uniref:DUF6153 family protein n=1 Tax=Streptomyces sp. SP18ES09 TaxID=3002532 RepID=UPI002E75B4E1|nr:DUF6153 family protein [Streptomyces sp. SP18ES09]
MHPRRAERGDRAGAALTRLLLVGLLALGVFLMHSTGHPEGSGEATTTASAAHHGTHAQTPSPHEGQDADAPHAPGMAMDMTTLCVAVLGVWLLAGLVRAALGRRPDWLALPLVRLTPALGPHAPPRRPPDLAQLSVLRI